jgi:AcrR family transcriptional regulator
VKQRRRREKAERRGQILDAARKLLFKKGLGGTSVNQIAREAELAIGTVYFYFRSKEDIFAALQLEGLALLRQAIQTAAGGAPAPEDKLVAMARAYLAFSQEHRKYFDVIQYFLSAPEVIQSPGVKQQVDDEGRRLLQFVEEVLAEGIRLGRFQAVAVRPYALIFWATIHGLIPFRKMKATLMAHESHAALYATAVAHFVSGLRRASATTSA